VFSICWRAFRYPLVLRPLQGSLCCPQNLWVLWLCGWSVRTLPPDHISCTKMLSKGPIMLRWSLIITGHSSPLSPTKIHLVSSKDSWSPHRVLKWPSINNFYCYNNNNNNIYLLQLGCYPVAVFILHVYKIWNWLLINLSLEGYMRSM